MAEMIEKVTRKGDTDDYTLQDLGWDRVPTWMEGKCLFDMISLKGKTALVTGAGGIGLGKDIAHSLAGLGAEVVLVDILESVHDVAKEVAEKWGVKTHSFVCDLTKYDEVGELFEKTYKVPGHDRRRYPYLHRRSLPQPGKLLRSCFQTHD